MEENQSREPCAIYSTRRNEITLDEIKKIAGDAKVELSNGGASITIEFEDCKITLNKMKYDELKIHLDGMRNFIYSFLNSTRKSAYILNLISRTYLIKEAFGTVSEPCITERISHFISGLSDLGKGIIFRANAFFSSNHEALLDPNKGIVTNNFTYWDDSTIRKVKSNTILKSKNIKTLEELPPVVSEKEVEYRTSTEIMNRIWALLGLASYSALENNITKKELMTLLGDNTDILTPVEKKYLSKFIKSKSDRIQITWRFESVWVLLWALKIVDELKLPSDVCNSNDIIKLLNIKINDVSGIKNLDKCELRSSSEILDELDLIYRCHWATTNARVNKQPAPYGLEPSVVYERHYALNWLTKFQNSEWDDISTET